jgi:hypothetical protein
LTHFINVRGTNGSGKTTIVRAFALGPSKRFFNYPHPAPGKPSRKDRPHKQPPFMGHFYCGVAALGEYDLPGNCGGTDKTKNQEGVCTALRYFAGRAPTDERIVGDVLALDEPVDFVFFEGLLVSGLFERYLEIGRELVRAGHRYTWAFLDTPLKTAYERTLARSGTTDPAKKKSVWDNVEKKHVAVQSVRRKVRALNDLDVIDVSSDIVDSPLNGRPVHRGILQILDHVQKVGGDHEGLRDLTARRSPRARISA